MKAQKAWSIIYWSGDENNVWNVEKKKRQNSPFMKTEVLALILFISSE